MKINLGIRSSAIILFLGLYITSIIILNSFFINQQQNIGDSFKNLKLDESISSLEFKTESDNDKAAELLTRYRESMAAIEIIQNESQIYSAVYLLLLMIISITAFIIIFYKITNPLREMQRATRKIQTGDFSYKLNENGIREIRELKKSFNHMSRELSKTQKKLINAEKEMIWKELSRILAHEIKNPLTPIRLTIERLEEKYELNQEKFKEIFPESAQIINQEISNLQSLVSSFSSFAKNINPEFRIFNPYEFIENILQSYNFSYNISLEGIKRCMIEFDQTHFYQIVTNILQNAIDVTPEDEKIKIRLITRDTELYIEIKDNGPGIASEYIEKIFEPYFTQKKKGTGLGLALVKKLAEVNHSDISLTTVLGSGSCFIIKTEIIDENINN